MISAWHMVLGHASPDRAVLLGAAGCSLIALELNRPGLVIPGALGLLLVLLAIASLHGHTMALWALVLLVVSLAALLLNLWVRFPVAVLALATLGLTAGLRFLVSPADGAQVHGMVALTCGIGLGASGAFLSRVAFRARRAKRVN